MKTAGIVWLIHKYTLYIQGDINITVSFKIYSTSMVSLSLTTLYIQVKTATEWPLTFQYTRTDQKLNIFKSVFELETIKIKYSGLPIKIEKHQMSYHMECTARRQKM